MATQIDDDDDFLDGIDWAAIDAQTAGVRLHRAPKRSFSSAGVHVFTIMKICRCINLRPQPSAKNANQQRNQHAPVQQQRRHLPQTQVQIDRSRGHGVVPGHTSADYAAQPQMQFSQPQYPGSQAAAPAHRLQQAQPSANARTSGPNTVHGQQSSSSIQPNVNHPQLPPGAPSQQQRLHQQYQPPLQELQEQAKFRDNEVRYVALQPSTPGN